MRPYRGLIFFLLTTLAVSAQKPAKPVFPLSLGQGGKLVYVPDEKGNQIPDFSYCGFEKSEKPIPFVPVRVVVSPIQSDATGRIQAALDYVAGLPADAQGLRGAVLLQKGRFEVAGSLKMSASGVVLRGSGMGEGGTLLFASGSDRETLIHIVGGKRKMGAGVPVTNTYLPVNAMRLTVAPVSLKIGDRIRIRRPSTVEWIKATGTERFGGAESAIGWKPGNQDIYWDRTVKAVSGFELQLDAPLTTDMDPVFAVDTVYAVSWPDRMHHSGVENLQLESAWDSSNLKDENHRWMAIVIENAENSWVRRVTFRHFAGSAVYTLETAAQITVEDCKSFEPISEIGGYRRNTFMNDGQLNLFQRCVAEQGYHDFALGQCAAGPNAFVQCFSSLPYSFSGTLGSWASGILFDNVRVDGQALNFSNRRQDGQGAGWSAANSVFWQCKAAVIDCPKPPMAQNWAFGNWCQFQGDGFWTASSESVSPQSLFYAQLAERLGVMVAWAGLMPEPGEASSSPTYEVAAALSQEAKYPARTLAEWIDTLILRQPISLDATGSKKLEELKGTTTKAETIAAPMTVTNGWLVRGNSLVLGARRGVSWWNGNLKNNFLKTGASPHLTRWVPGRTGIGFTDDLQELTDEMCQEDVVATDYNYALWYDRRRDDHIHERRMDGDVWAPFYELPFARSGQGLAYDGLSKYDLTKWNSWYWKRLKTYADLADQKGLVLFYQNFFQHNIIEAAAHWADCPWRTANNINGMGFPEPVNFAGDKRIFFADQFYDLTNATRKALYKGYIRKCLNNFKDNNGVIQFIGHEYTGPKAFVEFWLDVIGEWEQETGKNALVCLSTTKDVQDSILVEPKYNKLVEIIDTKYWRYEANGKMYAPPGGMSLAPRQHLRLKQRKIDLVKGNAPSEKASAALSPDDIMYWTVRDYRDLYPQKAVLYSSDVAWAGWPAFMGGGSVCGLPANLPKAFLESVVHLKPMDSMDPERFWLLGNPLAFILYVKKGDTAELDLTGLTGSFNAQWINTRSGEVLGKSFKVMGGKPVSLPAQSQTILWLFK